MEIFAYLDAGTGSLIVQAIIGSGVAIAVVTRRYWHRIRLMFGGKGAKAESKDLREKEK